MVSLVYVGHQTLLTTSNFIISNLGYILAPSASGSVIFMSLSLLKRPELQVLRQLSNLSLKFSGWRWPNSSLYGNLAVGATTITITINMSDMCDSAKDLFFAQKKAGKMVAPVGRDGSILYNLFRACLACTVSQNFPS